MKWLGKKFRMKWLAMNSFKMKWVHDTWTGDEMTNIKNISNEKTVLVDKILWYANMTWPSECDRKF